MNEWRVIGNGGGGTEKVEMSQVRSFQRCETVVEMALLENM